MKTRRVEFKILNENLDIMICELVDLQNKADNLTDYINECFDNDLDVDEGTVAAKFAEIDSSTDNAEKYWNKYLKEKNND